MLIRNILILIVSVIIIHGCTNNDSETNDNNSQSYVAIIDSTMTLSEVARANQIGEPYLRTMLGIPKKIGSRYDVATMAKRFKFTLDDLRKVIEDEKNKVRSVPVKDEPH